MAEAPSLRITRPLVKVLTVLLRARDEGEGAELHGWAIAKQGQVTTPTVYNNLGRLEALGWVVGRWETQDSTGPRRRFYRLTDLGRAEAARIVTGQGKEKEVMPSRPKMTRAVMDTLDIFAADPTAELYGAQVAKRTGLAVGTVYVLLDRLTDAGWLAARWQEPEEKAANPQGPRRRYYRLASPGAREAQRAKDIRRTQEARRVQHAQRKAARAARAARPPTAQEPRPEVMGVREIADFLGVARQRVHQLIQDDDYFPEPLAALASGKVWLGAEIRWWARDWGREPGRPPQ